MTAPVATRTLSASELTAYLALVQAQASARQKITQTTINAALSTLQGFNGWWKSAEITAMVADILKMTQPAQTQVARLTDAYVANSLTRLRGRPVRPVGAVDVTQLRRKLPEAVINELATGQRFPDVVEIGDTDAGPSDEIDRELESILRDGDPVEYVDPADAYGRLADRVRHEVIANGMPEELAVQKMLVRAEAVVRTDMQLAARRQEIETMTRRGVTLYRRVLHPELADSGLSCGLCIVAADRLYTTKTLREIHDNCNCTVMPIENGKDPGVKLNEDDLESLYRAAGRAVGTDRETGGSKAYRGALKRVRVAVTEHGELGPILVKAGTITDGDDKGQVKTKPMEEFTARSARGRQAKKIPGYRDAADYARTQVTDPKIRARAQLESLERSLAALEEKVAAGVHKEKRQVGNRQVKVDVDSAVEYHRAQIAKLRRIAG